MLTAFGDSAGWLGTWSIDQAGLLSTGIKDVHHHAQPWLFIFMWVLVLDRHGCWTNSTGGVISPALIGFSGLHFPGPRVTACGTVLDSKILQCLPQFN